MIFPLAGANIQLILNLTTTLLNFFLKCFNKLSKSLFLTPLYSEKKLKLFIELLELLFFSFKSPI